jgi:transcriptional regulator with XRE-family HTH domain
MSQLELALEAEVSARHVSFLESGRTRPSEEMVLRLMAVLQVPLRDQNQALRAAGLEARFAEPALDEISPEVEQALAQMMAQHEPYPLTVLTADSVIVRRNRAADVLFGAFLAEPAALAQSPGSLDMFKLLFDPRLMRPFVVEWEALARGMVSRLHRENLQRGGDPRLHALLERVFAYPGVPAAWRHPDFSSEAQPTLTIRLARGELRVGFLVAVTVFSAPQQVTLDELRIESCFPLDEETRELCARLAATSS